MSIEFSFYELCAVFSKILNTTYYVKAELSSLSGYRTHSEAASDR